MDFGILGPLEVAVEGRPVRLAAARERQLLVRLLLDAGRAVSVDRLVEDLWGGEPPGSANVSVRVHISRLRKTLGSAETIRTEHPGYAIHLAEGDVLDAARFEELTADGREALGLGDAETASRVLSEALDLWRGPALADVADLDFARSEAARLEDARLAALEDRIEADLALGRHSVLVGELEALTAAHPLRERLWGQRIVALYRSGRQADALAVYQQLRATLVEELGIDPSPELAALEAKVLAQAPELAAPARAAPARRAELPSGVVTFLLTDIEGSTRLWDAHPDEMAEALERHDGLVARIVESGGGHLLQSKGEGDSTLSVFRRASEAVSAALALQQALEEERWPGDLPIRVRVGIHTGEAHERDGDYFGPAVNRAARIRSIACGGQVLVSQATAELVHDRLPKGAALVDLGRHELKGLSRSEQVHELVPAGGRPAGAPPSVTEPRAEPFPPPFPLTLGAYAGGVFVGREQELERLQAIRKETVSGERRAVFVAGEPGIGKTRLAAEFGYRAHREGAVVLYGRLDEEALLPYQPFVEALRGFVATVSPGELSAIAAPSAGELARLVPEIAQRVPNLPPPISGDPEGERYRLFEAVVDLLAALVQKAPVVLVFDDLHWADKPTLLLLKHLLRSPATGRLMLLGTYRETELGRGHPLAETLADLRREQVFERILVKGLPETDVGVLIGAWSGADAPEPLTRAVYEETDGNPFFVVQVLRHLTDAGIPTGATEHEIEEFVRRVGIPEGIREVIGRRLALLSDDCNEVLRTASVLGREFDLAVLAEATGTAMNGLLELVEQAASARIVAEVSGHVGRYAFVHALIRETLYQELSAARRAHLHGRIGEALETLYAANLEQYLAELAHHFLQAVGAGDSRKAVEYSVHAGDRAVSLLAYEEAVNFFQRALQILEIEDVEDEARRCQVLLTLGDAQIKAGDADAGKRTLLRAAEIARSRGSPRDLALAAVTYAGRLEVWLPQYSDPTVYGLLEEAAAALPGEDSLLRLKVLTRLCQVHQMSGTSERVVALGREALEIGRRLGDPAALAAAMLANRYAQWIPHDVEVRMADAAEIVRLAREVGDREAEIDAHRWGIYDCLELGEAAALDLEIEAYWHLAEELRQPGHVYYALAFRAMRSIMRGRFEEGERLAVEAREVGERFDRAIALNSFFSQVVPVLRARGELAAFEPALHEAAEKIGSLPAVIAAFAVFACDLGREQEARAFFELLAANDFDVPQQPVWIMTLAYAAEACAHLGDAARAAKLYEMLRPYARFNVVHGPPALACVYPVSHCLGLLATTLGDLNSAAAHFEDALGMTERLDARPLTGHVQAAYAGALLERSGPGDDVRAYDLLAAALATAEELGMPPLAAKARALLRPSLPSALAAAEGAFFVGREQELARLSELWSEANGGARKAVLISGEPGIGKTRLAAEFARRAHADGAVVLYGRSDEEAGIPNQPFVEALTAYVARCRLEELKEHVGRYGGDLARLVPELARRLPDVPSPAHTDPEFERYRVFEAVTGFLSDASKRAPIVLVLDDLHWATKPMLLLLRHVLRADATMRLLVLGTYRETDLDRTHPLAETLADLRRDRTAERIPLAGFDEQGVYEFLVAAAGHDLDDVPTAHDFARALHAETEGNPFFIREVLSHLGETGIAYQKDGRWTSDVSLEEMGLPQGVREAVARRLARLSEAANKALAVAAVCGATFSVEVLERVPEAGPDSLLDALDEARDFGLIEEAEAPGEYRFAHALVRQTLTEEVSSIRRVRLHRRIAEAMEQLHARDLEPHLPDLARHFFEAAHGGDVGKAVEYSRRAGEQAMTRVAYEEAAEHFRRALEALALAEADEETRADLLLTLGEAEARRGDAAEAKRRFLDAADIARRIGSADRLARAALGFGVGSGLGLIPFPPDQELTALLEESLDAIGGADSPLRVRLLCRLAAELAAQEHTARLEATARQAVQIAERLGDPSVQLVALDTQSWALLVGLDGANERLATANRMLQMADEIGDGGMMMRSRLMRLRTLFELLRLNEAEEELEAMAGLAEELRQPYYAWLVTAIRSGLAAVAGRFDEADRLAQESWNLGRKATTEQVAAVVLGVLVFMKSFWQGRFSEAGSIIAGAMERLPSFSGGRAGVASVHAWAGNLGEARALFEDLAADDFAGIPHDAYWAGTVTSLVSCAWALQDERRAAILYEQLLPYEDRCAAISGGPLVIYSGSLDQYLGMLAATMRRWDDAERHFEKALRPTSVGSVYQIQAGLAFARMLFDRDGPGDRDRAHEQLAQVIATADEIGADGWADLARKLLAGSPTDA